MAEFSYDGTDLAAMSHAPRYHRWILDSFRPYLGKRVAEIGSGSGLFTRLLAAEPVEEIVAVEPAGEMYPILKNNLAGDPRIIVRNAFFPEISRDYPGHFDTIIYVSVLEHVKDEAAELAAIKDAIKEDGYVCIFVPALSWLYSEYDAWAGHYRRYHKRSLTALLENAGFEVVQARYFDFLGIIPWLIAIKWLHFTLVENNVTLYDRIVVPFASKVEAAIPPPLGKNLVVIARKASKAKTSTNG